MNNHQNARLTVHGRALLVQRVLDEGLRPLEVAQAVGVSARTVYKWVRRYREEGEAGLHKRSSRPAHCPRATSAQRVEQVVERRRQRQSYRQIVQQLGTAPGTVARLLRSAGLNRLAYLDPRRPDNRYEREAPASHTASGYQEVSV